MLGHPVIALRVAVAHMIAGSPLWTAKVEPQRAADAAAERVENSLFEVVFDAKQRVAGGARVRSRHLGRQW